MMGSRLARYGGRPVALAVLMVVLFLTFLDNTVVSVVLGSVQTDLHTGVTFLQWVVSAYALTFASAMLACGMVGDEFGSGGRARHRSRPQRTYVAPCLLGCRGTGAICP